ncbi:MAG: hypothetical protein AAFQ82_19055, partial [Myxococcota bacterium]
MRTENPAAAPTDLQPQSARSVSIAEIQGLGHESGLQGETVATSGVVTSVDDRGFTIQARNSDNNPNISDGLYIFTNEPPTVSVGNEVRVEGRVKEFRFDKEDLSSTQLSGRELKVEVLAKNVALPKPVLLGRERPLPNSTLAKAALTFESLEHMRVQISGGRVIGPSDDFGNIYIVP